MINEPSPWIGLLFGAAFTLGCTGLGRLVFGRFLLTLPGVAQLGLCGLLGLGTVGLATFIVGLISTSVAIYVAWALAVVGLMFLRPPPKDTEPNSRVNRILGFAVLLLLLVRIPSALTPSGADDWDSISHQMTMSKLWLEHGRFDYIPFMHQSNVPATVNMLYMAVLPVGGQFAAKAIMLLFAGLTLLTIGGLARMQFGRTAGLWAMLAFVATPVVLWEIGTAYVDIAHGAYTGLAILFIAMALDARGSPFFTLGGLCLGFSMGTKYTGLQTAMALLIVSLIFIAANRKSTISRRDSLKGLGVAALISVVLACPWYIRNVVNTGNPVYPFFYGVFGGSNWSKENAEHYVDEQRSFGIGQKHSENGAYEGKDPTAFPGSVTALALEPDKQINLGTPWGAIGPLFVLGLLWWPLSRRLRRVEAFVIATALISLGMWFYLTQQSRYIIGLMVPAAFLLGGAVEKSRVGKLAGCAIAAQGVYTFWLFALSPIGNVEEQIYTVFHGNTDEYMANHLPFWQATKDLNRIGSDRKIKVALYDEVRGYYLDVDYWWANPGHSRIVEYEKLKSPTDLVSELRRTGTTHVYMNFSFLGDQGWELRSAFFPQYFAQPMGMAHVEAFRKLLVSAWQQGSLKQIAEYGEKADAPPNAVLFEIAP